MTKYKYWIKHLFNRFNYLELEKWLLHSITHCPCKANNRDCINCPFRTIDSYGWFGCNKAKKFHDTFYSYKYRLKNLQKKMIKQLNKIYKN